VNERSLKFGPGEVLVGTITLPEGEPNGLGVVLLNAGFIHRIGPHRLNVRLARTLARQGCTVLRFDLSGLGDSERSPEGGTDEERADAELVHAMDTLARQTGVSRFVVAGLCSGTDPCLRVGATDPRIVGSILLDTFAFPTFRTRHNYRMHRLRIHRAAGGVGAALVRRLKAALTPRSSSGGGAGSGDAFVYRLPPPKPVFEGWLRGLLARGGRTLLVYTSGFPRWYNYEGQFRASHGRLVDEPGMQVRYVAEANHTFTALPLQERLLHELSEWVAAVASSARAA
jgi:pimeloyl-ACP methyl ester carboxylesterase